MMIFKRALNKSSYNLFCKFRWLIPSGLILGYIKLRVTPWKVVYMPLCRLSKTEAELKKATQYGADFWGLPLDSLKQYELHFTYGVHMCGSVVANGCTHPYIKVDVALQPQWDFWDRILLHELAHVFIVEKYGHGDNEHKLKKSFWHKIPTREAWTKIKY